MSVRVDKAGRDHEVGSVDRPCGAVHDFADFDNSAVCNRHVRAIAGRASPIDYGSIFDQQIVRHSRAPQRHSFNLVGNLETFQKSSYGVKDRLWVRPIILNLPRCAEPLASYGVSISDLIATGVGGGSESPQQFLQHPFRGSEVT